MDGSIVCLFMKKQAFPRMSAVPSSIKMFFFFCGTSKFQVVPGQEILWAQCYQLCPKEE